MTKQQQMALHKVYLRDTSVAPSYLAFRRKAQYIAHMSVVMVQWCGMWLGIELDGYTHS